MGRTAEELRLARQNKAWNERLKGTEEILIEHGFTRIRSDCEEGVEMIQYLTSLGLVAVECSIPNPPYQIPYVYFRLPREAGPSRHSKE